MTEQNTDTVTQSLKSTEEECERLRAEAVFGLRTECSLQSAKKFSN